MSKRKCELITSIKKVSAENLLAFSLIISPLFLLTVSGWMTRIVLVCGLLAIYVLFKNKTNKSDYLKKNTFDLKMLTTAFALPLIAIFLSQTFRGQYAWSYYDSPAHILISISVLWAMLKTNSRIVEFMSYTFPIVTLLALANILINPNLFWGASRLSTQALDPLEFGSLSLTFGILSLISIKLHKSNSKLLVIYKLIGFFTGIYLSLVSGSRTGWMALPIIGFLWIYFERAKFTYLTRLISALSFAAIIICSYLFSATVQQRTDSAVNEITNYHWNSPNPDTSVGARISFIRIAIFLLEKKPLSGWGDGNFESVINDPALNFAVIETKTVALKAGFHNDITANMVRSGIWGLIATMALLLIPALFFMRSVRSNNKNKRDLAFIALAFLICQFVSSLSMEIFTLKYSASFYGLMMAIFCGQILYCTNQDTLNSNGKIL